jgi:hypothetical protein
MRNVLLGPDADRLRFVTADPDNTLPSEMGQSLKSLRQSLSLSSGNPGSNLPISRDIKVEGVTTSLAPRMNEMPDCESRNRGALLFPQCVDRLDHRSALGGDQRRHPPNEKQQDDHRNVRPCV